MKKKKTKMMLLLGILLLSITIGYAILSSNLNINGTSIITNPKWDIHFENVVVNSNSVEAINEATINSDGDTVTYEIELNIPGEFYEFTVDVVNAGTIDGMIESVTSTVNGNSIEDLPYYIEYYVKYTDGMTIKNNHLLSAGERETYVVHIGFKKDIEPEDLPTDEDSLNLSFNFVDIQKDSNATPRHYSKYVYSERGLFVMENSISEDLMTYDSYEELVGGRTNIKNFLKAYVIDDIPTELYVGYVLNDNDYYLRGGDNGAYHESNKEILKNSFGEENCREYEESGDLVYSCSKSGVIVKTFNDGYVGAVYGGWLCDVYAYDNTYASYCAV